MALEARDDGMFNTEAVDQATSLMMDFAERTGVTGKHAPRRYLWTDAFAVCNFIGLARTTGRERYLDLARSLVAQVHQVLGHHRPDSAHSGWLSGLTEQEGAAHPTAGGLRIGKELPERGEGGIFDERLEWERDGQYFHYLTKWMHALDQMAQATGEARYNCWARELGQVAHRGFVTTAGNAKRMVWKMSVDLSRVLVPSMGQHDALDGWISCAEMQATAGQWGAIVQGPDLGTAVRDFALMTRDNDLRSIDPLGVGGLLTDALRVAQLLPRSPLVSDGLLDLILRTVQFGLDHYARNPGLQLPASRRLAFRELGLAIGLKALDLIERASSQALTQQEGAATRVDKMRIERTLIALSAYRSLRLQIESFWLDPRNRSSQGWLAHQDINEVMLATCLAPEGFFGVESTDRLAAGPWLPLRMPGV